MITSLLLATLLTRADKITLNIEAMTVDKAFAKLSEASGVELTAQRALGKEIVVLHVNDADFEDVKKRLAKVIFGHWEATEKGFRLVRSDADTKEVREAKYKKQLEAIQKGLKRAAEDLQKAGPLTEAKVADLLQKEKEMYEKYQENGGDEDIAEGPGFAYNPYERDPGNRLVAKILLSIGAERLAALNGKGIFATRANHLQIPLNIDPSLLRAFNDETVSLAKAYKKVYPPDAESGQDDWSFTGFGRNGPLDQPPSKMILKFTENGQEAFQASLMMYGSKGENIGSASLTIGNEAYDGSDDEEGDGEEPEKPASGEEPLKVSPLAAELALVIDNLYDNAMLAPSRELAAKLLVPEKLEPLSLLASEVLHALADRKKENLIACLPDDTIDEIGPMGGEALTPTAVMEDLSEYSTSCEEKDGWIMIAPNDPLHSVANRADRKALGRLMKATQDGTGIKLDDYAGFALESGNPEEPYLASIQLRMLLESSGGMTGGDWTTLKFYGSLTTGQKAALLKGGKIVLANLSGDQREWLTSMLLEQSGGPRYFYNGSRTMTEAPGVNISSVIPEMPDRDSSVSALASEPTEFLSNGLPLGGWIEITVESNEGLDVKSVGSSTFTGGYIGSLAMNLFSAKHPEFAEPEAPVIERLRTRTDRYYTIMTTLAPGLNRPAGLSESLHEKGGGFTVANLPENLRKQMDEYLKDLEEQLKSGDLTPPDRSNSGKGGVPPPQR